MRPWLCLLLTINWKFAVDIFARGLHTRTAVTHLPLYQLGFLVCIVEDFYATDAANDRTLSELMCMVTRVFIVFSGVNVANSQGWTALMFAAYNGHQSSVRTLLDNG